MAGHAGPGPPSPGAGHAPDRPAPSKSQRVDTKGAVSSRHVTDETLKRLAGEDPEVRAMPGQSTPGGSPVGWVLPVSVASSRSLSSLESEAPGPAGPRR